MLTKKSGPIVGFLLGLGLLAITPVLAQGPLEAPTPPASSRFFTVNVQVTPLNKSPDPMQDVKGVVIGSDGKGIEGISVKVTSPGWQAFDVTKPGGTFKFSLTKGDFVMTLDGLNSQEGKVTVDGKSDVMVQFTETAGTKTPTPAPATATPTATLTPTVTNTPEPTRTTVITVSTPVGGNVSVATSTPGSASQSSASQNRNPDGFSLDALLRVFATGAGFGLVIAVAGVGFVVYRRNRG